jgi:hypothetical protein
MFCKEFRVFWALLRLSEEELARGNTYWKQESESRLRGDVLDALHQPPPFSLAVGHWMPRKGCKEHVHGIEGHWSQKHVNRISIRLDDTACHLLYFDTPSRGRELYTFTR